jgi:hypothetical protein
MSTGLFSGHGVSLKIAIYNAIGSDLCSSIQKVSVSMTEQETEVRVRITPNGIEIERDTALFSKENIDWSDVAEVKLKTNEENIRPNGKKILPLLIDGGEMQITSDKEYNDAQISEFNSNHRVAADSNQQKSFDEALRDATGIKIGQDGVEFPEDHAPSEVFADFVRFAFENDYLTRSDLPIQTPKAQKNYVLNTSPEDSKGNELPKTKEPIRGVFFDQKPPKSQKEYYVEYIVENYIRE